jgi:hypothetical protein
MMRIGKVSASSEKIGAVNSMAEMRSIGQRKV